jgi:hypothetical protein
MALDSVQKAILGSIFYCYQIHLIVAVSKVLESLVIIKVCHLHLSIRSKPASFDSNIQRVTVLLHDQTSS